MAWTTPATFVSGAILTASQMNVNVRDNTNALYDSVKRYGYVTRTSTYAINQTTIGSAANVFSSSITWTADGTSTYWVEFYCTQVDTGSAATNAINIYLTDGSSGDLGQIARLDTPAASTTRSTIFVKVPYAPAAGSRTVNVRATYAGGTGNLVGQTGGSGQYMPIWMAVYGPDLT